MAELATLARPYAKAAFESALYSESLQTWSVMLNQLASVTNDERVKAMLSSPSLTGEQQAQIVIDLCGDEINEKVKNFIFVLSENNRLPLLAEIVDLFEVLKANQELKIEVDITSAFPLAESTQEKIALALKGKLKREVEIHSEVDKSLIGGIVVRAGDLVIDGSVRGKLSKLAEAMNT